MGQRLVLSIVYGDNDTDTERAVGYYHWSGYTDSGMATTAKALEYINDVFESMKSLDRHNWHKDVDLCGVAIKALEHTGAGINDDERTEINQLYPQFAKYKIQDAVDRNEGLISVTPHRIEETLGYGENFATIYLTDNTVYVRDLFIKDYDPDEYNKSYDDEMLNCYYDKRIARIRWCKDSISDHPKLDHFDQDEYPSYKDAYEALVRDGFVKDIENIEDDDLPTKFDDLPLIEMDISDKISFDAFKKFYSEIGDSVFNGITLFRTPDGCVYSWLC